MRQLDWHDVDLAYQLARQRNVIIVSYEDKAYPPLLREIYDPPPVFYLKGEWRPEDHPALAIVGTRNASQYAINQARRFASELARLQITVVSGLARGVDIAGHYGALNAGGRTIAVLGSGLGQIYPPEHGAAARAIEKKGALLSEYPVNTPPLAQNFPKRNRIISGLTVGTIVIEAGQKSGALITAHQALEQGREVFAVPGEISRPQSAGSHRLIQQGAKLVTNIDEILEEIVSLSHKVQPQSASPLPHKEAAMEKMTPPQRQIWEVLGQIPQHIDQIVLKLPLAPAVVSSNLLLMEMNGWIHLFPGHRYSRP